MRVAINGFGRIGNVVFRIMNECDDIDIVAINYRHEPKELAYTLKYDTCHRRYRPDEIKYDDKHLIVGNKKILCVAEDDPLNLPWKELNIDMVFECTGKFNSEEEASKHIKAGAKKVIISAPAKGNVKTIVYGVNEDILTGGEKVISASSCTTNCLAPVLKVLNDNFGIKRGYMTTVHAYTNDQNTLDGSHKKGIESRRGRAAAENIIPTSTGAAESIGIVIPELDGRLKGSAMRVPVADGSVVDLVLELEQRTTVDDINKAFVLSSSDTLGVTNDPIVSCDVLGDSHGGVVDLLLTDILNVDGKQLVKVVAWYDNEFGYSNQMVRTAKYFGKLK